jgi:hypothetical protein
MSANAHAPGHDRGHRRRAAALAAAILTGCAALANRCGLASARHHRPRRASTVASPAARPTPPQRPSGRIGSNSTQCHVPCATPSLRSGLRLTRALAHPLLAMPSRVAVMASAAKPSQAALSWRTGITSYVTWPCPQGEHMPIGSHCASAHLLDKLAIDAKDQLNYSHAHSLLLG